MGLLAERPEFDPEKLWITVFEGDAALGLGPDEEAIEAWLSVGVPRERIVQCPRSENFWQAGPIGPCGPCSELYYDRGLEFGTEDDLPGGENERFLEYWNLVFMQYKQDPENVLTPLPEQNIDTGLGLNRMAALLQGVESIFDTDQFVAAHAARRASSATRTAGLRDDRSLRILADHTRGTTFLIADGVVPSNEDRGYVLRRIMRRAIQHGRRLGMEPGFLLKYADGRPRDDGPRVPGARPRVGRDHALDGVRGGELRPHARARHAAARGAHRRGEGARRRGHRLEPTRSGCTTRSASRST